MSNLLNKLILSNTRGGLLCRYIKQEIFVTLASPDTVVPEKHLLLETMLI